MTVQQCDHCKKVLESHSGGIRDNQMVVKNVSLAGGYENAEITITLNVRGGGMDRGDPITHPKHDYCVNCAVSLITTGALPKITATR